MKEIRCAAIKLNGKVYVGKRHSDVIWNMVKIHGIEPPISGKQGFVTKDGEFVDRKEAAEIAFKCGQILKPSTELFSEDLY